MRQDLRRELLQPTLKNALRTPFYQSLWTGIDISEVTLDTLHALPLVTKEAIRQAGECAQIRDDLVCDEFFTMGTRGQPLVTVRGDREQNFIRDFFETQVRTSPIRTLARAVKFNDPYHGSHIFVPSGVHCHRISVFDAGSFVHARRVMSTHHTDRNVEPRCTLLIGGARCLRAFTDDTIRHYPSGFDSDLDCVISLGEYTTKRWRDLITETWQAEIVDRFSLSEIFGGATQSLICGWWHFDPFVIAEVICSHTRRPIEEGIGILVLTALHPFQEAQPLVRYLTEDLVQVTYTKSSKPGELAIRPLGRAIYGVPDIQPGKWLLSPAAILEAVDMLPEIERMPLFRDAAQVGDPFAIGQPRYTVSHNHNDEIVTISISIDVSPSKALQHGPEIRDRLIAGLLSSSESLDHALRTGRARLDIDFSSDIAIDQISCPA